MYPTVLSYLENQESPQVRFRGRLGMGVLWLERTCMGCIRVRDVVD